jgi:CheY-like chemotaxis protein
MQTSPNILVIDDDDTAREVTGAILSGAGFTTHPIASPIGATRAVRELSIDAVVCDLNMPAMQGDALARLFRQSKSLRLVPLVLISGAPREELAALIADGTVDAIVHKSDLATVLVQQLRRLLARR